MPLQAGILHCWARDGEVPVRKNDFDYDSLAEVDHRPFPQPQSAWIMTQSWHDVLFLHWPVDRHMLQQLLPPGLEVDTYEGQAYVAVAPFHMTNVAPRGVPAIPGMSAMPELNVRTYIKVKDAPGIYFFSLDAGNSFVVGAARSMFHLPYYSAKMRIEEHDGWLHYRSKRSPTKGAAAEFIGRYRGVGEAKHAEPGSLEYFLVERYCLFTLDDAFRLYRVDVHHGAWDLMLAEAEIEVNTMADAAGIRLPAVSPLAHYIRRQDTIVWPLTRVDQ